MKINRENDIDEVMFLLRLTITNQRFDLIKNELENITNFEINKKGAHVIIIIDIEDKDIDQLDALLTFVKEYKLQKIDIFCGITSSYDLGGFTFPQHFIYFANKLNCEVQFSYVIA